MRKAVIETPKIDTGNPKPGTGNPQSPRTQLGDANTIDKKIARNTSLRRYASHTYPYPSFLSP